MKERKEQLEKLQKVYETVLKEAGYSQRKIASMKEIIRNQIEYELIVKGTLSKKEVEKMAVRRVAIHRNLLELWEDLPDRSLESQRSLMKGLKAFVKKYGDVNGQIKYFAVMMMPKKSDTRYAS